MSRKVPGSRPYNPDPCVIAVRKQSFNIGEQVRVTHTARHDAGVVGQIVGLHLDPVHNRHLTGGIGLHARYDIEIPSHRELVEAYDWELAKA